MPPVDITQDGPALVDFFFGGPPTPTDSCWEATVTAGPSRVSFFVAIRDTTDRFAGHQDTRVTWSKESGRIALGDTTLPDLQRSRERPVEFVGQGRVFNLGDLSSRDFASLLAAALAHRDHHVAIRQDPGERIDAVIARARGGDARLSLNRPAAVHHQDVAHDLV